MRSAARAGVLLLAVLSAGHAQEKERTSLRERMEAARQQGRDTAAAAHGQESIEKPPADPMRDPDFWRIYQHAIPTKTKGLVIEERVAGGDRACFYARTARRNRRRLPKVDDPVFFYALEEGCLRFAGRGVVEKVRAEFLGDRVVEARILSFRYARLAPRRTEPDLGTALVSAVAGRDLFPMLAEGMHPARARWFISSKLTGPDVADLTAQEKEKVAKGLLWQGMSEALALAALGHPESVDVVGETKTLTFAYMNPPKIEVRGGKVAVLHWK